MMECWVWVLRGIFVISPRIKKLQVVEMWKQTVLVGKSVSKIDDTNLCHHFCFRMGFSTFSTIGVSISMSTPHQNCLSYIRDKDDYSNRKTGDFEVDSLCH